MGRLTEAMALINISSEKFTPDWIKTNCTTLTPPPELKSLRRAINTEKMVEKRATDKLNKKKNNSQ